MLDHDEIVRLYGSWRHRAPEHAATLLQGYSGRWWVAGGWAIDAFTGDARPHGDLDLGIPRGDAGAFVDFVTGRLDAWAAAGSLTPLRGEGAAIPAGCGNLWLRPCGDEAWEYDILLEHVDEPTWRYKRDPRIYAPVTDVLWERDGISYLRPEVQLLLKARHLRPQDQLDLDRCAGRLDQHARSWLTDALRLAHPGHPWIERLCAA